MKSSSTNGQGKISRRTFLANSTALATAVGALSGITVAQDGRQDAGRITDKSKSDPGPTNAALDAQNPSSVAPPVTDAGSVPAFKYPFSLSHKRLHQGGWSREVTVRELPVSKSIAGVDMRLTAGGIRELHWHAAAEWAFMLYGSARIASLHREYGRYRFAFSRDVQKQLLSGSGPLGMVVAHTARTCHGSPEH